MDDIELLVAETFRHFQENYSSTPKEEVPEVELPNCSGLLYHIQKSASVFVIRSLVSQNIKEDFQKVLERPEDYPSLRLIENGGEIESKLRTFIVDNPSQAEIIHDQVGNRRFPVQEELMCNLSDPGFSWWLTKKKTGFQISFNLSSSSGEETTKLGSLGDRELAMRSFRALEALMRESGLDLNIQNEMNRVQFSEGEEFLLEELKDLFEFGVVSDGLIQIFKLISKRCGQHSELETLWFYLQELAALRRFWIQVQYDLNA